MKTDRGVCSKRRKSHMKGIVDLVLFYREGC